MYCYEVMNYLNFLKNYSDNIDTEEFDIMTFDLSTEWPFLFIFIFSEYVLDCS